jgi:hypothetical protein
VGGADAMVRSPVFPIHAGAHASLRRQRPDLVLSAVCGAVESSELVHMHWWDMLKRV